MAKPEKIAAVAEIAEQFRGAQAAVLTEYRGLTMAQLTELRRSLGRETTYAVVKNTLTRRAAADAGVGGLDDWLTGPTAIAFIKGDPVEAAKGLRAFARTNPLLVIKGGLFEGRTLTADDVNKIADLDSREVVLAKLAGAMKAKPAQAAALFQAPLAQVARLAVALRDKLSAQATADGPADGVTDGAGATGGGATGAATAES
ncbi:MAG TPA: 50S ribosomal protein L10 [Mycobacteriales bacterium]|nr:50S ribosomal protein L10 [Mycobacteriales bacterium]